MWHAGLRGVRYVQHAVLRRVHFVRHAGLRDALCAACRVEGLHLCTSPPPPNTKLSSPQLSSPPWLSCHHAVQSEYLECAVSMQAVGEEGARASVCVDTASSSSWPGFPLVAAQ